jgi:hypothetical protein
VGLAEVTSASAANIPLTSGDRRVMTRWLARQSGVAETLYIRVKVEGAQACRPDGRDGYAAGSSGVLVATTHPVNKAGRPVSSVVLAQSRLTPCNAEVGESIALPLDIPVRAGDELATVVRNAHQRPQENYFSTNHLYVPATAAGASGEDVREVDSAAPAGWPELDPREAVGYSDDGGATWELPGGPYGESEGRVFLPTYIVRYSDGRSSGQPYYYALPSRGEVTMSYPPRGRAWAAVAIQANTTGPGAATAVLLVDGRARAQARLAGPGIARARIDPVRIAADAQVTIRVLTGPAGLSLPTLFADRVWADIWSQGSAEHGRLAESPRNAVPLIALEQ